MNNEQWLMGENRESRFTLTSGQAIILIAISMVALLAIIGLAIDGGRLLLLRRDAQNANDAAVLSAVFSMCTGGTEAQVVAAGEASAASNGFTNEEERTTVLIDVAPDGLPAEACAECSVGVTISRQIDPYFIQLVYKGGLEVTTYAVGTCTPDAVEVPKDENGDGIPDNEQSQLAAFWGGALPGACNQPTVDLAGSDIVIKGDIHGNSDVKINPSNQAGSATCATIPSGSLNGGWTFGNITYGSSGGASGFQDAKIKSCEYDEAPGETVEPPVCGADCQTNNPSSDGDTVEPEQVSPWTNPDGSIDWPVDDTITAFRTGGAARSGDTNTNNTVYDGFFEFAPASCNGAGGKMTYASITSVFKNPDGSLKPGIYYSKCNINIDGNDFANANATFVAEGQISAQHPMNITGYYHDLVFFANGPAPSSDTVYPQGGPSCNGNGIHMSTSNSTFEGIIFAPNGNVQFSSSMTSATIEGCVVGYTTKNSSSGLEITCEPDQKEERGQISFQQ